MQPQLWVHDRFSLYPDVGQALVDSVAILNDALPPEFQIRFAGTFNLEDDQGFREGDVAVVLLPPEALQQVCGADAVACAQNDVPPGSSYTHSAVLAIPDDLDTSQYTSPRATIIHELLHSLGVQGHVDSIEFPDSILGTSGDFFPNPGFTIHRIDREVLQIMYMSQHTARYNDFAEWSDTTLHIVGRSEDEMVHFGVALFNGLPQPWARGDLPDSDLGDNAALSGTVTWSGKLLAFSGPSPVAGDVALEVSLDGLDEAQDLKFRDLFFINRFESQGDDRWFPSRNLDYEVSISEGVLFGTSTEDSHITGAFLGAEHEGMAGTIKRTDLAGAFGGTR